MVRAVSQDKQGRIWIGTDQDGIDILDKKTGEVRQLRNKAGDERSLQMEKGWESLLHRNPVPCIKGNGKVHW